MEFLVSLTTKFENIFLALGAGEGFFAPLLRSGIGFLIGVVVMEALRPSIAYSQMGRRPWAVTNPNSEDATFFPWWLPGAILAILFGLFV
jgi:hypothetical protein